MRTTTKLADVRATLGTRSLTAFLLTIPSPTDLVVRLVSFERPVRELSRRAASTFSTTFAFARPHTRRRSGGARRTRRLTWTLLRSTVGATTPAPTGSTGSRRTSTDRTTLICTMTWICELCLGFDMGTVQDGLARHLIVPEFVVQCRHPKHEVPRPGRVQRGRAAHGHRCCPLCFRPPTKPIEVFRPHALLRLRHQPPARSPESLIQLLNAGLVQGQTCRRHRAQSPESNTEHTESAQPLVEVRRT